MTSPAHSLVVCTYNRRAELGRCLDSLLPQLREDVELIVIDDGSTDDTPAYLASLPPRPRLRIQRVTNQGLSLNRDLGARLASAPWVTYLDDDAWVPEGWLDRLRALCANLPPETAAVGGRTRLPWRDARPAWMHPDLACYLTEFDPSPETATHPDFVPFVGANMTVRREWVLKVGGFADGCLGRKKGSLLSREETWFWKRIRAAGARGLYDSDIWVWHDLPPSRLRRRWFLRRLYWEGYSCQIEHSLSAEAALPRFRRLTRAAGLVLATSLRRLPRAVLSRGPADRFKAWIDIAFQLGAAVAIAKGLHASS